MTYLGLAFGPSLAGWLTQTISWRAAFYINVPIGVVALAAGQLVHPVAVPPETAETFDFSGALVFMVGLVPLLLRSTWDTPGAGYPGSRDAAGRQPVVAGCVRAPGTPHPLPDARPVAVSAAGFLGLGGRRNPQLYLHGHASVS